VEITRDQVPVDVRRLLGTVPAWFGVAEANTGYVAAASTLPSWVARIDQRVVGVLLERPHNPRSSEIELLVVDREHHRQGIGSALLHRFASDQRLAGIEMIQVKTLGPSRSDPGYEHTRRFYEACGFVALEELDLWGPDNPALLMAATIDAVISLTADRASKH
jgi:GNAT superfamily N-acetyltransferase